MKRSIKTIVVAALVAGVMVACASQNNQRQQSSQGERGQGQRGQGGAPTFAQILSEMDANGDGKLAESEVKGPLKNDFSTIDTDEDGFISESEFENAPKPERGQGGGGRR